jgi:hypothetical protein
MNIFEPLMLMMTSKCFMRVAMDIWSMSIDEHKFCRNPTLAKCGGEAQHLEKVRSWSPPGLPNV